MSEQTIKHIFNKEVISELKNNKDLITTDLLQELRDRGNEGKKIALEILDLHQDNEAYYLDSFGGQMSMAGNRRLKKPFVKVDMTEIHKEELTKCATDIFYFMNNYVRITTPKGINFVDPRPYQNDFIDLLYPTQNEAIVSLQPRQSGKSVTVAIYLAWLYIFDKDMIVGIAANKASMSKEFLNKTKNILVELPMWMQNGTTVWNKTAIESENGMRIMADATSQDSFRGFTCNIIVVDETAFIRPNIWDEFADSIFPSQSGLAFKKTILISTANGLNHFFRYVEGARNGTNGFLNYEVDWRDVPRYHQDGTLKTPDEFQQEVIAKYGIIYWNQNY